MNPQQVFIERVLGEFIENKDMVAGNKGLFRIFCLLVVEVGIFTMVELTAMLHSGSALALFEEVAARAWKYWSEDSIEGRIS